jgi:glycine reductase complex component B subunit alpha and beta
MKLELAFHPVEEIRLAGPSRLDGKTLFVDPARLEEMVGASGVVRLTGTAALHPGERVRAAPVLDIVEPRAKDLAGASAFPGWTGVPVAAGHGLTHVLSWMAVAAVGRIPGVQEGMIDMSPEAAAYSPFSRTRNLVLLFEQSAGADRSAVDQAIRTSLLRVAEFLAGLARGVEAERMKAWDWPPVSSGLPRAACLYLIQSQGELRRTYIYGQQADTLLPTLLDPLEVWDGAVVSGNFVLPCNKTCTYIHQNQPVIAEMF